MKNKDLMELYEPFETGTLKSFNFIFLFILNINKIIIVAFPK